MSDIFISYAREDRERVAPIAKVLEALGWSLWWDPNILSGAEFDQVIARELQAARCVLVVWSGKSVESRWVRGEARDGLNRGIAVPVMLDAVPPPLDFRAVHATDFSQWRGEPDSELVVQLRDSISQVLDRPPNPSGPAELKREQAWHRRLTKLRITTAALALALVLVVAFNYRSVARALDMASGAIFALSSTHALPPDMAREFARREAIIKGSLANQLVTYVERRTADAWGGAQLIVGSDPQPAAEQRLFEDIMPDAFDASCQCWAPVDGGQHAVATAWTILAHVMRGRAVSPEVIRHLLGAQWGDGPWPLYFDAAREPTFASTYATAFLALALHEYRKSGQVDPQLAGEIDQSVARAGAWLFAHRPPRGGRWADYPDAKVRQIASRGISALIVYVFHRVFHDERAAMVRADWLAGLDRAVAFDFLESSDQYVDRAVKGAHHDGTRYIVFSWELAALTAGYEDLAWRDRVRAQWFLSDAMKHWSLDPKTMELEWLMAELAFALREAERAAEAPAPR